MAFINTYKDLVLNPNSGIELRYSNTGAGAAAGALGSTASLTISTFSDFFKKDISVGAVVSPIQHQCPRLVVKGYNQPDFTGAAITEPYIPVVGAAEAGLAFTIVFELNALTVSAEGARDSREWGRNIMFSFRYDTLTNVTTVLQDLHNAISEQNNALQSYYTSPAVRITSTALGGDVYQFDLNVPEYQMSMIILDEYKRPMPSLKVMEHRLERIKFLKTGNPNTPDNVGTDFTVATHPVPSIAQTGVFGGANALRLMKRVSSAASNITDFVEVGRIGFLGINTYERLRASIRLETDHQIYPTALRKHEWPIVGASYKSYTIIGNHTTEDLSHCTVHQIFVHTDLLNTVVTLDAGTALTQAAVNTSTLPLQTQGIVVPVTAAPASSLDAVLTAFAANI